MQYRIEVRSALLRLIELLRDERLFADKRTEGKALSMYSHYRNPPPFGQHYVSDEEFLSGPQFRVKYDRLEELLLTKIPRARSKKSLASYRAEAIATAIYLWESIFTITQAPEAPASSPHPVYLAETKPNA